MQEQYDLFTTNPGTSGYRLDYLEIYNWGTFNGAVYRIAPDGNNSLLTGANASGKSTLIDALLTLLVPFKKIGSIINHQETNAKETEQRKHMYSVITAISNQTEKVPSPCSDCVINTHILLS